MISQIDDPFPTYSKICKLREKHRKLHRDYLQLIEEAKASGDKELLKDAQACELLQMSMCKNFHILEGLCTIRDSLETIVLSDPDYDSDPKSMDQLTVLQAIDIANNILKEVDND